MLLPTLLMNFLEILDQSAMNANCCWELLNTGASELHLMLILMCKHADCLWISAAQLPFVPIIDVLSSTITHSLSTIEGQFLSNNDASKVGLLGTKHQEQELKGRTILRPVNFFSKPPNSIEMKYGMPKLELFATMIFIEVFAYNLVPRRFSLVANSHVQLTNVIRLWNSEWEVDYTPKSLPHGSLTLPQYKTCQCWWSEQTE